MCSDWKKWCKYDVNMSLVKHMSCDCKCEYNSTIFNSNQKWNSETCQCEYKKYCTCKRDYNWNPSVCI